MNKIRRTALWQSPNIWLWSTGALLLLIAATGGAARADVQSLVLLRPFAVMAFAIGLLTIEPGAVRGARGLFVLMGLTILLLGAHIAPLPPTLWRAFPQGDILSRIDAVTQSGPSWRPFTLDPYLGSNAFWSWFVPASVLVAAARVAVQRQERLLSLVIAIGALSTLLGMLQVLGGRDSVFYLYQITNRLSMVGLLANRNHAALLLAVMFPLVAAWVRLAPPEAQRFRQIAGLAFAVMLAPSLLATGSRAGLVLGVVGAASVPFVAPGLFQPLGDQLKRYEPGTRRRIYAGLAGSILAFLAFSAFAIGLSTGNSLDRLMGGDAADELRGPFWTVGWQMVKVYFPWGSGFGSFVEVFQMFEPHKLLDVKYANHAHNDWLELLIEAGLPGVLLALGWAAWLGIRFVRAMRRTVLTRERVMARAGGVAVGLMILASFPDYPLRTPLLASLGVLFAFWLALPGMAATELAAPGRPARSARSSARSR